MKVLLVHNFYRSGTPGGEDNAFRQERDLLQRAGVQVVEFTRSNDDVDERDRIAVARTALGVRGSAEVHRQLAAVLAREQPDVAHVHNTFPLITASAYRAIREAGVPIVQTLHNYRFVCGAGTFFRNGAVCERCTAERTWPGVLHRCYRNSVAASAAVAGMIRSNWDDGVYQRDIDAFIVLSEFAARRFAALGLPSDRLHIKPNFVDALDPPSDGRGGYVVFAGRLSEEKGVRTLVRAWRNLRHIPLKILGDGPLLGELRARVAADRLPIEFPGMMPRDEVLKVIGGAEFQVIASECFEGFPLVLVESYSRGTPVLASRTGSLEELVQPGVTGAHFIPGEAASLAAEARRLWADPELLRRLRDGARARFLERYTPASNLDTLLGIYARVARQRAASPSRVGVAPSARLSVR